VAFEGGGAKGLVHVGALKALENRQFQFCGVAGTSAGAIIAALKAAGYSADEIVNPTSNSTILDRLNPRGGKAWKSTDLFGPGAWTRIKALRTAHYISTHASARTAFKLVAAVWLFLFCLYVVEGVATWDFNGIKEVSFWTLLLIVIGFVGIYLCSDGLATASTFRDQMNFLLSSRLFPDDPMRSARMGDFGKNGLPILKIVAADITTKKLRLFSSSNPDDAEIHVADAVAASVCLPVVFKPWTIGTSRHFDGGLVSNLPVWPFDEERSLDPDALTLAITIAGNNTTNNSTTPVVGWLTDTIQTTLFGSSILNMRAVNRLEVISLPTTLNLLQFDLDRSTVSTVVRDATAAAENGIDKIFEVPALCAEGARVVQQSIHKIFASHPFVLKDPMRVGRVRVALAVRGEGNQRSLRLRHPVGFDNDTDEDIVLPIDCSIVGEAWQTGKPILRSRPFPSNRDLPGVQFRRIKRLFAQDIEWILAVPIYSPKGVQTGANTQISEPLFIVAVDGSAPLVRSKVIRDQLAEAMTTSVRHFFEPLALRIEDRD